MPRKLPKKKMVIRSNRTMYHHRKKKKKKWIFLLLPIFILVGGMVVYGGSIIHKAANAISNANDDLDRGKKSKLREKNVKPLHDNVSILIAGIDDSKLRRKEQGDATRSDALL